MECPRVKPVPEGHGSPGVAWDQQLGCRWDLGRTQPHPLPPKCAGRLQVLPGPLGLRSSKGLNKYSRPRTQRLHLPEASLMCR